MAKGQFIVLEGIDGSGKRTQWQWLVKKLGAARIRAKQVDEERGF